VHKIGSFDALSGINGLLSWDELGVNPRQLPPTIQQAVTEVVARRAYAVHAARVTMHVARLVRRVARGSSGGEGAWLLHLVWLPQGPWWWPAALSASTSCSVR